MGKIKQIATMRPIPSNSFGDLEEKNLSKIEVIEEKIRNNLVRVGAKIELDLLDLIRDYAFWRGMKQEEAIIAILSTFLKENKPKERPKEAKERDVIRLKTRKNRKESL
jgi:hypothetical protein